MIGGKCLIDVLRGGAVDGYNIERKGEYTLLDLLKLMLIMQYLPAAPAALQPRSGRQPEKSPVASTFFVEI